MAAADLVISRAGANTLAEIAALGKPSLLIPLPASRSRGDQLRNAAIFRSRGASVVLEEDGDSRGARCRRGVASSTGTEPRADMGRCASTLGAGRPDQAIADLILERLG